MRRVLTAVVIAGLALPGSASAAISVVAAENFYGDLARQLAGPQAAVNSILTNPDVDPHLFEASPSVARALSDADIVIYNGADYDPWMGKLLGASRARNRRVIVVADLVDKHAGDNPHLWYDPASMVAAAQALTEALAAADPGGRAGYEERHAAFLASLQPLQAEIASLRQKYRGTTVTATEPVFGYMAAALGLVVRNARFQLSVMNDTEPAASDIAAFEGDLRGHAVRVLLFNSQASNAAAKRLLAIAQASQVPVVGVSETEPAGITWQTWMLAQLQALAAALQT